MSDSEEEPDKEPDEDRQSEPGPDRHEDRGDAFPNLDELLGTFMREPSLWPVLVVFLGSGGVFGAALIILATIDRNPFAAGALVLILGMTVDILIRSRRNPGLRNVAKLIGLVGVSACILTGVAIWTGLAATT